MRYKVRALNKTDARVAAGVTLGNLGRTVRATIVHEYVCEIGIGLRKYTLDTLGQIRCGVKKWRDDAHKWLGDQI